MKSRLIDRYSIQICLVSISFLKWWTFLFFLNMTDVLFDTEEQRKPPTKNKSYQIMAITLKFMQSGVRREKKYLFRLVIE